MKPYGYKKLKNPPGDGCFLCTRARKTTKTAARQKARTEARRHMALSKVLDDDEDRN